MIIKSTCVVFFDSLHLRSQYLRRRWIYYITATIREQMTWRDEEQQSMWVCHAVNSARFLRSSLSSSMRQYSVNCLLLSSQNLQPIRTRRLIRTRKVWIRKVWNSIRLRNRYRSAVSASVSLEKSIDLHINLQISLASIRQDLRQDFQQDFHFDCFDIYLSSFFCFRISSAFAFISSRLSHLLWDFQLQQWFVTMSTLQSMNFFAMSIDRRNEIVASKRNLKKTKR